MAYTRENFPSKKAFRQAFTAWKEGLSSVPMLGATRAPVEVFQPGPFGPKVRDGRTTVEGPHFPKAHTWYADVEVLDGKITKIYG